MNKLLVSCMLALLTLQLASAIVVNSVESSSLVPGEEGEIRIEVRNILQDTAQDISFTLDFHNTPFTPIGSSQQSTDEIQDDDEEDFTFVVKASNEATPGNYEIPYTIMYTIDDDEKTSTGTIGIEIAANPDLVFTVEEENAIMDENGKITLKVVNKGLFNARFVSVRVIPEGFTLLSDDESYIGEIESDDFETVTFDAYFTGTKAKIIVLAEYKDFDNKQVLRNVELPIQVYTKEKAIELGLIQRSNTIWYILLILLVIILIILWRVIRRRRRAKRNVKNE